jgi:primary-amine oxidase
MMMFRLLCLALAVLLAGPISNAEAQTKKPKPKPILIYSPFDALTPDEVLAVSDRLEKDGKADEKTLYGVITLLEPPKADVLKWKPKDKPLPRQAFVVLRRDGKTFEAVVDLSQDKIVSVAEKPGEHPMIMDRNWLRARDAFMKDPRLKTALEKRGLKLDDDVLCTPNSAGAFPGENTKGRHILKVPCFSLVNRLHPNLARPIEGLMGIVDAETGEVLDVWDREVVDLPPPPEGYGDTLPKPGKPIAGVGIGVQGQGNMKLSGNLNVDWLNWSFHVRADKRAGMIVSLVRFNDGKKLRDIAYQMNISEMFVPYMDPNPTWTYRTFMDAGEFGLGYLTSSLRAGVDCPDTAAFIDMTLPNDIGGTYVRERGMCIFERPTGDPAWRHYTSGNKRVNGQPQIELVVRHIPTLGNYDYVVDYVFTPQGTIKLRVGATGFDAIKSVASTDMDSPSAKDDTIHGALIAPYTVASNHDHYFNYRLDLDTDGTSNTLVRDTFVPTPVDNESGRKSLWTVKTQRFLKEGPIVTDHADMAGQILRLVNPNTKNSLKQTPSLWLNAHHDAQSILDATDPPQARAQFSANQFWLTRFKPNELWAAGLYPNLSTVDEGLPKFVGDAENATAEDLVIWYTMGFRHLTRPEDFPILPTFWHEMTIRPAFFFDRDPSMTFNLDQRN